VGSVETSLSVLSYELRKATESVACNIPWGRHPVVRKNKDKMFPKSKSNSNVERREVIIRYFT
jgi:hypothetical protein